MIQKTESLATVAEGTGVRWSPETIRFAESLSNMSIMIVKMCSLEVMEMFEEGGVHDSDRFSASVFTVNHSNCEALQTPHYNAMCYSSSLEDWVRQPLKTVLQF